MDQLINKNILILTIIIPAYHQTFNELLIFFIIIPKNTYVINLSSLNPSDIYNQEYQYFILDNLLNFNYKLCVIRSDLENMICPSGFSHFLSCCIGNIIVSQDYGINNITLGYTLKNIHY